MTQHLHPGWWISALAMVACAGANAADVGRGCASDDRASYICGVHNVEDMLHIEGTPWVLAGRLTAQPAGSGFYLISIEDKSYSEVKVDFSRSAAGLYPACPGAPRPDQFAAHGIAIRYGAGEAHEIYAVNHGGRESIEVFDLSIGGREPRLVWKGCVLTPAAMIPNAVTPLPEGPRTARVEDPRSLADRGRSSRNLSALE